MNGRKAVVLASFRQSFAANHRDHEQTPECRAQIETPGFALRPLRVGSAMVEMLLVRHGQSEWNAQGRWQGQADPPLTQLGLDQADAAGQRLASLAPFDAMVSSTLDRAATTADVIAGHLGHDDIFRTPLLAERSAGEWSGLTRDDIDRDYPGYLRNKRYPPGYEHDPEFLVRIRKGLAEVVANVDGERLLVLAHGGLIYCIEASCGLSFRHISNLGGRFLHLDEDQTITLGDRVDLLSKFSGEKTTPGVI